MLRVFQIVKYALQVCVIEWNVTLFLQPLPAILHR